MKVAIIGGGICGLYLAWKLSEAGHNITVFERKEKIGQEVCSGLFSERILKFIPESKKLIQNEINSVLLHFPKKTITVNFSKRFFVLSHFELDILVAGLSQKAGAKIILNHNVSSMPEDFDRIIGCDGANSFVRRSLEIPDPIFRLAIQGFIKKKSNENYVETWPVKNGFIWKIPRGEEIEYGIIAKPKEAKIIFDNFLEKNRISLEGLHPHTKQGEGTVGAKINKVTSCCGVGVKSKIVPQGFIIPSKSLITLCGDASGLTKPWSGGGVIWGLTSAEILLRTFPDFLKYKKEMKKFFLPKIIFSKIAVKLVYFLGFRIPSLLLKKTRVESDFLL